MALGEMNSGNDIITDTGLTQEGMPADAKSVGDKINAMGPWITFGSIKKLERRSIKWWLENRWEYDTVF